MLCCWLLKNLKIRNACLSFPKCLNSLILMERLFLVNIKTNALLPLFFWHNGILPTYLLHRHILVQILPCSGSTPYINPIWQCYLLFFKILVHLPYTSSLFLYSCPHLSDFHHISLHHQLSYFWSNITELTLFCCFLVQSLQIGPS